MRLLGYLILCVVLLSVVRFRAWTAVGGGDVSDRLVALTNPNPYLGEDTTICENQPYLLSPTGTYSSYLWSTGDTGPFIIVSTPGVYHVEVTDSVGCVGRDSITIEVLPAPMFALPDTTLCTAGSVSLSPDYCMGCDYYFWSTGDSTATISVNASGSYILEVRDTSGCRSFDTSQVQIYDFPGMLGPDSGFCAGDSILLDPGIAGSHLWSTGSTDPTLVVSQSGQYWVEVSAGICMGRDTMEVEMWPLPLVDLGADTVICEGDTLLLDAGGGAASYSWSNGSGGQFSQVWSSGMQVVQVTSSESCMAMDEVEVTVQPLPVASIDNLQPVYCESDEPVVLNATPQGGVFSGPVSGGVFDPSFWGPGQYQMGYTYVDPYGCRDQVFANLAVDALPSPAYAGPDGMTDEDAPFQMEAETPIVGQGTWSVIPTGPLIHNPSDPNTLVSGNGVAEGTYIFTWTVSNGTCPSESDDLGLLIHGLMIPTGFSPNDDEKNDKFVIRGLGGCEVRSLRVFNRWGDEVYYSQEYNGEWDGAALVDDTYFYVLNLGEKGKFSGYVVLKR